MPDGGNDRHHAGRDGAGDKLFVEFPQVFEAAATAGHDDDIDCGESAARRIGKLRNGPCDFHGGPASLHANGRNEDGHMRRTPLQNVEKITDGCAGRRSDDSDPDGVRRECLFALLVEKSLGAEFFLQGAEARFEFADPARLHAADDDLVLSARLVDRNVAEYLDLESVAQGGCACAGAAEDDA